MNVTRQKLDINENLENAERLEGASPSLLRLYSRLDGVPTKKLEDIARASECQLIPAGTTVFRQDEDADSVYLLLDGAIELEHREAGEASVSRLAGPRQSFGDIALLGAKSRYYTASTTSVSVVIRTPLTLLRDVLAQNPELAQAWIHAVSADVQRRERRLAGSMAKRVASPALFDAA